MSAIVLSQPETQTKFEPENMGQLLELSSILAKSSLIPSALRDKPADVAVTLMTGRELGLSPMQSLRGISVIEGKGALNADLLVGLVLSRPSICIYFRLVESDDTKATYETHRKGLPTPTSMTFTIEQAKKANLLGKKNWISWPAAMLRARCSAHLARAVYQDLVAGIYTDDEADEIRAGAISARSAQEPRRELRAPPSAKALPAECVVKPTRAMQMARPEVVSAREDPPLCDPETGEVVEGEVAPPAATEQPPGILAEIEAATRAELSVLAKRMGDMPDGPEKLAARTAINARSAALRG